MKKQDIKKLQEEQNILSNSINLLKDEKNKLKNTAKDLKDLIAKRKLFIENSEKDEIKAKEDLGSLTKIVKSKQKEFDFLTTNLEKLSAQINKLNWQIFELQKTYNEKQKECNKQTKVIDDKIEKKKNTVIKVFDEFKANKEKEEIIIQDGINVLNKKIQVLENGEATLQIKKDNIEKLIVILKKETAKSTNDKKELESKVEKLKNKKKKLDNSLEKIGNDLVDKNEELLLLKEKIAKAQKELNKVLTKTVFLINKEDHLKGFEEYIKEISQRLGLDYQPYQ